MGATPPRAFALWCVRWLCRSRGHSRHARAPCGHAVCCPPYIHCLTRWLPSRTSCRVADPDLERCEQLRWNGFMRATERLRGCQLQADGSWRHAERRVRAWLPRIVGSKTFLEGDHLERCHLVSCEPQTTNACVEDFFKNFRGVLTSAKVEIGIKMCLCGHCFLEDHLVIFK